MSGRDGLPFSDEMAAALTWLPAHEDRIRAEALPSLLSVPSEDAMFELLSAMNVSGITPELACSVPGVLIATLTDPDADHVHYVHTDEGGRVHCCECTHGELVGDVWVTACDEALWKPNYPVTATVTEWPDEQRCREDDIDAWWIATADALTGEGAHS